jgi:hypothetical protein
LPIEQPIDQVKARVLRGVRLLREQVIEDAQHVAGVKGLEGPPPVFFVVSSGMIDFKIGRIGEVTG